MILWMKKEVPRCIIVMYFILFTIAYLVIDQNIIEKQEITKFVY